MGRPKRSASTPPPRPVAYEHKGADAAMRPEVGAQAVYTERNQPKAPARYRYDSSLSPALEWDGQNGVRELGEWLIAMADEASRLDPPQTFDTPRTFRDARGEVVANVTGLRDALDQLKRLSRPFLNWSGKAERLSFEVPTLPLFIHERLSTKGIIESLRGHKRSKEEQLDLFADPQHSVTDQVLRSYQHRDRWSNRMILGDSLVGMNSLLHYEGLGGQVQMIYMDPPYGVRFGSNFQPFVRKLDVRHNEDDALTREPEMVQAYRDTWELGQHSYLGYIRDRLLLAKELLHVSGSIFVQIGVDNKHAVRTVMDEVLGNGNFVTEITFVKTTSTTSDLLANVCDTICWYAKDITRVKYRQLYSAKVFGREGSSSYTLAELADGSIRNLSHSELLDPNELPEDARILSLDNMTSQRPPGDFPVELNGREYRPGRGYWKTGVEGMERLKAARRLHAKGNTLLYKRYYNDFPFLPLNHLWLDTMMGGFAKAQEEKVYVVQTPLKAVQRCLLMTTDPGDLVLDPTCGAGTSAFVAEQWGRRWITLDVSRVPLALARQRLLTATFPWYQLGDEARGPAGGFVYKRRQNSRGEEVGGIVPHVTLKSIANDEPPEEEVLVDRPEVVTGITRVSGPFTVEATIPTPAPMSEGAADGHRHDP
jgi:adenine-specific DNA-methyltransferase